MSSETSSEIVTAEQARQGDVVFAAILVQELEQGMDFFHNVLGWRYEITNNKWRDVEIQGVSLLHEIGVVSQFGCGLFLCYAVDDINKAVERVVAAGGRTMGKVAREDDGYTCGCYDSSDLRFTLYQGITSQPPRPVAGGNGPGDLVGAIWWPPDKFDPDFYARVLGWTYRTQDSGSVEVIGTRPRIKIGGPGNDPGVRHMAIPQYRVDDLPAALAAVESNGGSYAAAELDGWPVSVLANNGNGTFFYLVSRS